jgi:hypothetical protein
MRLLTPPAPLFPFTAVRGGRECPRASTGGLEQGSSPVAAAAIAEVGGRGCPLLAPGSPGLLAAAVPALVAPEVAAAAGTGMGRGLMRATIAGSTTPPSSLTCTEGGTGWQEAGTAQVSVL